DARESCDCGRAGNAYPSKESAPADFAGFAGLAIHSDLSAGVHIHFLQPCAIALIHRPSPQMRRTNPPIDMTGEVTMPQKIIVMPSASRNGAYEGSTGGCGACGSRNSGNGSLEMFGRIIAMTPVLRVVRGPDTSLKTSQGLLTGR